MIKPRKTIGMRSKGPALLWAAFSVSVIALTAGGCLSSKSAKLAPSSASKVAAKRAQPAAQPAVNPAVASFHSTVEPILRQRCYDCHAGADNKTPVAFDALKTDESIAANPELWLKVLRNTRSHLMPPPDVEQPTAQQQLALEKWIELSAFGADPANLDPGRQTIRRLNRAEYHNTIKDLLGVEYDTETLFPSDDIGYGFDNIGDVLNISPMLMEKYLQAAQSIVAQGVPTVPRTMTVRTVNGNELKLKGKNAAARNATSLDLPYTADAEASCTFNVPVEGDYRIDVDKNIKGSFDFSPTRCIVTFADEDGELSNTTYIWKDDSTTTEQFNVHWAPGPHVFTLALHPTTPSPTSRPVVQRAGSALGSTLKILRLRLEGPQDPAQWSKTPGYDRIFTREQAPTDAAQRLEYARQVLSAFAFKAFRRPAPQTTIDGLVDIAQSVYDSPGKSFEQGVAQAIAAILASPRFLYRVESPEPAAPGATIARVDEYSLASRLSYFLWSTMPDEELFKLAESGQLRSNLAAQIKRMLADPRSHALVENFTGQWLQSREVTGVAINVREVMLREGITGNQPNAQVSAPIRAALKQEPEACFDYIMREDRSIKEFLSSDYIFVNQTLAQFYDMPAVTGQQMKKITLRPGDFRGGALTMGSTLMVTSNPTRTSPVKRGKWVLENILGAPTPPPPPDIPPLELAAKHLSDQQPTLRQTLEAHRANPQCFSCHARMDPLGLAMENFNAEGLYRDEELDQPIDASGKLLTGETFNDVGELKKVLLKNHYLEFYRCLTEKLMVYATGRGMEYYDMPTIDRIVDRLDQQDGRFSALLMGVIDSAPFQEQRVGPHSMGGATAQRGTTPGPVNSKS